MRIKNLLNNLKINSFKKKIVDLVICYKNLIKVSYNKCKMGEEKLNVILFKWSIIPCLFYLIIRFKIVRSGFIAYIIDLIFLFLSLLDYYFITKAVNLHPEYDTEKTNELNKIKYYENLSNEELEKVKKEEEQKEMKQKVKGLFFISEWKKKDFFKLVKSFLIIVILITIKRVFF